MGCICTGTDTINKNRKAMNISNAVNSNLNINNPINNNNPIPNQRPNQLNRINNQSIPSSQPQHINLNVNLVNNRIIPNNSFNINNEVAQPFYEPYLQSKNDPTFNMTELKTVFVGSDLKKIHGYICNIEKDELEKRREDFWSSRFEGSKEVWELLRNFCIGEFDPKELKEILYGSGLTPYAGCINVVYDQKGNLYEIPNYCIHDPTEWDIPKYKIKKPNDEKIIVIIRHVVNDYPISIMNTSLVSELKEELLKNNEVNNKNKDFYDINKVRLFYHGKELKNNDCIYIYEIMNKAIIQMMIKENE
jgi:hypothetical protein